MYGTHLERNLLNPLYKMTAQIILNGSNLMVTKISFRNKFGLFYELETNRIKEFFSATKSNGGAGDINIFLRFDQSIN